MFPSTFRVVVDACALYPFNLRDTLLRAAERGYFQLCWSSEILDEVHRNLIKNQHMTEAQAARSLKVLAEAFPEAMVTGYETLVSGMPNDEKDRYVSATAVKAGAQVVVTSNLKDFVPLPDGVEAQSPDEFLIHLFDLHPDGMLELLEEQVRARTRPPTTFDKMLDAMTRSCPASSSTFGATSARRERPDPLTRRSCAGGRRGPGR